MWQYISILKIERVENGMQEDGSAEPYYKAPSCLTSTPCQALQRGIENQGVPCSKLISMPLRSPSYLAFTRDGPSMVLVPLHLGRPSLEP